MALYIFVPPEELIIRVQTMSLLTFSMYMLAEHPDIEKRLRHEIFEKVGGNGRPTYDQMRDMRFMRAFLNGAFLV